MNLRVNDLPEEPERILLPIEGYEKARLMSLDEAVKPLIPLFPEGDLQSKVWVVKELCKNPDDGLSQDESASIMLYTIEWTPSEQSLYVILNKNLRSQDRNVLKPWFPYLRLFIGALLQLPPINDTFHRGVRGDMSANYLSNNNLIWWGVSSCTVNIQLLESDQFCGKVGVRTIFSIKCIDGRNIKNHSYHREENEILLLPGRYLRSRGPNGHYVSADGLHIIQLDEIQPEYPLLKLPDNSLWRRFSPGLSLLGECLNSQCAAHKKEVIIPIGLRNFDVLVDADSTNSKCPICAHYVDASKLGFNECQWRIDGIKQKLSQAPFSFSEEWSDTRGYSLVEYDLTGFTFRQIKVQTKPLNPN